jgi:CRISPR-associated protein Cas2
MALTVIVTNDVAYRFRGFLASVMLEIAAGVYISPEMNRGIRLRVWDVVSSWHKDEPNGSIVMVWRDTNLAGRVGIETLGTPPKELAELDGLWVTRRSVEKVL